MALRRLLRGPWLGSGVHQTEQLATALSEAASSSGVPSVASLQQHRGMARTVEMVLIKVRRCAASTADGPAPLCSLTPLAEPPHPLLARPQDHPHLGRAGDVVSVRPGHARLDLYPKQLAVYATPDNVQRHGKVRGWPPGGLRA